MMKKPSVHSIMLALVGGYLLYTAYLLFDKLRTGAQEMPFGLAVAAIVLFGLAGIGVLWYAYKIYQDGKRAEQNEDENELK